MVFRRTNRRYRWPELQLNIWLLIVLSSSAICLGIFAWLLAVQTQLQLAVPWYLPHTLPLPFQALFNAMLIKSRLFPFMVTAGCLGIVFIALILILAAQRFLLPGLISLGSFILFVLWLTGLIETSLQLYGVSGSVNDKCGNWVVGNGVRGQSIEALAWLTQITICMFPSLSLHFLL